MYVSNYIHEGLQYAALREGIRCAHPVYHYIYTVDTVHPAQGRFRGGRLLPGPRGQPRPPGGCITLLHCNYSIVSYSIV